MSTKAAPARDTAQPLAARPVLKWVGGKSRLIQRILAHMPEKIGTYYEPFAGSAAVFFALAAERRFKRAVLSDQNRELIDVYRAIKRDVEAIIKLLGSYPYDKDFFYEIRANDPSDLELPERAARTIYLNKTGFNGLYRVNRSGRFNVPFGRHQNPNICDEARLRAAAQTLRRVRVEVKDFEHVSDRAERGDAVYFDPPYVPLSKTSNFTAYHHQVFDDEQHERLSRLFIQLAKQKVISVLSNSDTPRTRELYKGFKVERILVKRPINSKSSARGSVGEILVQNLARRR